MSEEVHKEIDVNSSGSAKKDIQGEGLRDSPLHGNLVVNSPCVIPSPNEAEDGPENSLIHLEDKEGKEETCGHLIESTDDSESGVESKSSEKPIPVPNLHVNSHNVTKDELVVAQSTNEKSVSMLMSQVLLQSFTFDEVSTTLRARKVERVPFSLFVLYFWVGVAISLHFGSISTTSASLLWTTPSPRLVWELSWVRWIDIACFIMITIMLDLKLH